MAQFPKMKLTQQGADMLARAGSGREEDKLILTGVRLGDGQFDGDIRTLTDVVSPKLDVTIASYTNLGNGKAQCEFLYTNRGVTTGFYHREIGLMGKNGEDGIVKMLTYSNAGNYTSYIPPETEQIPNQNLIVGINIGDTDNVTAEIDVNNALTLEKFNILLGEHNESADAHAPAIDRKIDAHNLDVNAHIVFHGATASAAGRRGYVPAPAAGANDRFLCADATWKKASMTTLELVNVLYPVGIIVEFAANVDPNTAWPGTTWEQMDAGRVLISAGTYTEGGQTYIYTLGSKGGEARHQLTVEELASHGHGISISSVGNHSHGVGDSDTTSGNGQNAFDGTDNTPRWYRSTTDAGAHSLSASIARTGSNFTHENRMPYEVVSRWKRTA